MPENTTPADKAATIRLSTADGVGKTTATISAPDPAGTVVYRLRGPRILGAVSIAIGYPLYIDSLHTFAYGYGIEAGQWASRWRERLTVNGVQLIGERHTITREELEDSPRALIVRRSGTYGYSEQAPRATEHRTQNVLAEVLANFAARDDLTELWAAAARAAAVRVLPHAANVLATAAAKADDAQQEHRDAAHRLSVLRQIADGDASNDSLAALLGDLQTP